MRAAGERVKAATERARAEVALRESEERLAAIFSAASVGLSEVDASGRYLRVNTEMCRILGRSADEVLSVGVADVTDPAYIPQSLATIAQAFETGHSSALDKLYCRPDGTSIWAVGGEDQSGERCLSDIVGIHGGSDEGGGARRKC